MILEDFKLKGKTAIITGGGTGIGMGVLKGLAEAGADVACVYRENFPAEMKSYTEAIGRRFLPIRADLSRMESIPIVMKETIEAFGKIDILVNNAGICPRAAAIDYTEEMWDRVTRLNEKAVFFLSQATARRFEEQKTGGKIINIASMMSYLGGINTAAYTASKHAVMGLTRVLASEWGAKNIQVNAIAPGWIRTNLSEPLQKDPVRDKMVRDRIPQGDWGEPEFLKGVAVFLASAASNYVNGVTIPVDGGYLTK